MRKYRPIAPVNRKRQRPRTCFWLTALCLVFCLACSAAARGEQPDDRAGSPPSQQDGRSASDLSMASHAADNAWHVSVSPYLWLSGFDGNVTLGGHEVAVKQSFADILSNLKGGFTGSAEARRGRVGIFTDLIYIREGSENATPIGDSPLTRQVTLSSTTFTLTPEAAFRFYDKKRFAADALGGFRFYHLGASSTVELDPVGTRKDTGSDNWADVTGGAHFIARLTPRFGAFLIGDAGGGGSALSWEIAYGVGYAVTKRIIAQFGYRSLYFDRRSTNYFAISATQEGLLIGATLRLR